MTLEDVLAVYAAAPDARIVRLHSGDLALYSAIGEQIDWCVHRGARLRAGPRRGVAGRRLGAGRPRADRPRRRPVARGHPAPGRTAASMPDGESVAAFTPHGTTMAVYLSAARPDELRDELLVDGSGYRPDTPAAVVVRATWPDEQVVPTTVEGLRRRHPVHGRSHHRPRARGRRARRCRPPAPASTTRATRTATGVGRGPATARAGRAPSRPGARPATAPHAAPSRSPESRRRDRRDRRLRRSRPG